MKRNSKQVKKHRDEIITETVSARQQQDDLVAGGLFKQKAQGLLSWDLCHVILTTKCPIMGR